MTNEKNELTNNDLRSMKMREQPIGRLLLSMSLPAMFSMLVQALYNIVDTMFVAKYNSDYGLEALSVVFPMQMLFMAFAIGIGVGTNVQIAKKLGEDDLEGANATAKTGVFIALVSSAIWMILSFVIVEPFINAFTDNEEVREMASTYLRIVMLLNSGMFVEICCSKILQSTGNMKVPMISQLIGAITNIILDPIFIFEWGFGLGVAGAAIATVIGQFASMTFVLIVIFTKKQDVSISFKGFRPKKKNIFEIMVVGLPTMVMNAIGSVTTSTLNLIVKSYNGYIAILGAYFKLQSFVFMPVFGLTQGALPVMSYNYGFGDKKRYDRAFRLSVFIALGILAVGVLLFQVIPEPLLKMFSVSDPEIMGAGVKAFRRISLCFLPAAMGIMTTTAFQSLSKGLYALCMSLLRQLGFLIPSAIILSKVFGGSAVWFCYPIAEVLVFVIFFPISQAAIRKMFAKRNAQKSIPPYAGNDLPA